MHIRIKIRKQQNDPSKDLEIASSLRRDLWVHSPIEIDVDDPSVATHRDPADGRACFEFETAYPEEVDRIVRQYAYTEHVDIERRQVNAETSST